MSTRLAFQTQLASIMEVLANAAVAEICKLVDDDYAVVSLQMSQCQRENKALKRKLHLLELKMARGTAERRLRESAMNSGRPRVHVSSDRLRDPAPSPAGAAFEQQMEASLWSGRATAEDATSEPVQSESPDVELVEPEAVLVKEEKVEPNMSQYGGASEALVGEAVVESVPQGAAGRKLSLEQQELQSSQSGSRRKMSSSRGVEVSDSSPLLKGQLSVEDRNSLQETINSQRYVDSGNPDSHFDVLCDDKSANLLVGEFFENTPVAEVPGRGQSCSYFLAAADLPSTSSSMNGWARYPPGSLLAQPTSNSSKTCQRAIAKERLFMCNYCGKAFNRPKKLEIHKRVHTGEKPFSCSTCGKMFSEAGNLRKHQRVHTGEKPYSCGMCGRGFAWIRNLKTHQVKSHPDIYTEETWEHN
ncbi:uncharacterized protein ACBR49_000771 isoform 2-T2 [Aulostomus maculatus]